MGNKPQMNIRGRTQQYQTIERKFIKCTRERYSNNQKYLHLLKNKNNEYVKDIEYRMESKKIKKGETRCTDLYNFRTHTTPRKVMYI